jgi:AraC-like DNA-binding protein
MAPVDQRDGRNSRARFLLRLAQRYGRFHGEDDDGRFEILRWLFWDNHKLSSYMATYRFLRTFTSSPDPQVLAFLRKRLDDLLGIAEQHLHDRLFVVGNRPTVADLSMVGYLFFPKDESGYDLAASHPALQRWLDPIAALPGWRAQPDVLYVDEGSVLTAAGSATGIDLCLHVVRRDYGPEAANSVARRLVVPPHREGGQVQFIERPLLRSREGERMGPLIDWIRCHLAQEHTINRLARRVGMSGRTFQRRFEAVTGLPPGQWITLERLRYARDMLESEVHAPLEDIAAASGFGSLAAMRHHFRKRLSTSPSAYRDGFAPLSK